jgi:hypothetical protein
VENSYAPLGRVGSRINVSEEETKVQDDKNTKSSDPVKGSTSSENLRVKKSTIGGNTLSRNLTPSTGDSTGFIYSTYGQKKSLDIKPSNPIAKKIVKEDSKGRRISNNNIGVFTNRSIQLSNGRIENAIAKGTVQNRTYRYNGPAFEDLYLSRECYDSSTIKDGGKNFEIHPVLVHYGTSPKMNIFVMYNGESVRETILLFNVNIHTSEGILSANLGNTGIMTFGTVNPPTPGMYIVSTPTCLPGQGSLPTILAGNRTWEFMTLVMTLITIEGNTIAQQTVNFLPTGPSDLDIIAPNRLPSGLMRALEMDDTSYFTYDGTFSHRGINQYDWWRTEPHVLLQRTGPNSNSTVSIVIKSTVNALSQESPFRPLLELYENNSLLNQGALTAFVSGRCGAQPGWYNPATMTGLPYGGSHTACQDNAGGTIAYIVDSIGQIQSGPYNPGIYAGSHTNYMYFKYDPNNPSNSNSSYINAATLYRLRVYNNGPISDLNGYVVYTKGLGVPDSTVSVNVDSSGKLAGSIRTYHCNQTLKVVNLNNMDQVERYSSDTDGTIYLGDLSMGLAGTWIADSRLSVTTGDIIRVYRPGYDNLYGSNSPVVEFTVT